MFLPIAPCPFCSAVPELQDSLRHGFFISCENPACPVMPETRDCETPELAAEAWNARPVASDSKVPA